MMAGDQVGGLALSPKYLRSSAGLKHIC